MPKPQTEETPSARADWRYAAGVQAWTKVCELAIAPSPRNFELMFTHFAGLNLELSKSLHPFLSEGEILTAGKADGIYAEFISEDTHAEVLDDDASTLSDVAQNLVDDISSNKIALIEYGRVLDTCAEHVNPGTRVEDLLRIIEILSTETTRSSERNQALEQKLAASSLRISRLRQHLVEVRRGSTTDALTGISNRRAFDGKLRRALGQANADAAATFSLVMLDVDHFKRFNDTHGHRTGDQVLKLVARLLADNVKGRDTAARYGGEEFALILANADLEAGLIVADQTRQRLSSQSLIRRGTGTAIGQITISAGVAQHRPGETGAALIERADRALYDAKFGGRNRVCAAGNG